MSWYLSRNLPNKRQTNANDCVLFFISEALVTGGENTLSNCTSHDTMNNMKDHEMDIKNKEPFNTQHIELLNCKEHIATA